MEKGHGRIEQRSVKVTDNLDWFPPSERKHWLGLRSIVEVTATRDTGNTAQNLALNLLRADKTVKDTIRGKRIRVILCKSTLEAFLKINSSK